MTMHAETERLWHAVHQLRDELFALRLLAVEDRPRGEPNQLVDHIGTLSETLVGWAEEVLDGAARAVAATDYPPEIPLFRRALDRCTDGVERLGAQLHEELAGTRRLDELNALARRGGPELRAWVGAIKDALDQIRKSLWTIQAALTICWRELADRVLPGPVPQPADTARRS
jgi:hypothetical protein